VARPRRAWARGFHFLSRADAPLKRRGDAEAALEGPSIEHERLLAGGAAPQPSPPPLADPNAGVIPPFLDTHRQLAHTVKQLEARVPIKRRDSLSAATAPQDAATGGAAASLLAPPAQHSAAPHPPETPRPPLPAGWTQQVDSNGYYYYWNRCAAAWGAWARARGARLTRERSLTGQSSWEPPTK
jgi:hypothetical protein